MPDKALSSEEISKLLAHQPKSSSLPKWPSEEDLVRLAKAVKSRLERVEFKDGKEFKIRYSDRWDAVCVSPANGEYVPCGYFSFDRLKGALTNGVNA